MQSLQRHGIALTLDTRSEDSIIAENHRWAHLFSSPFMGTTVNRPHITLFQGVMTEPVTRGDLIDIAGMCHGMQVSTGGLVHKKRGWVFLPVHSPELADMHRRALCIVKDKAVPGSRLPLEITGMGDMTPEERENFCIHGYRYSAGAFFPHVTLGRGPIDQIPLDMARGCILPQTLTVDQIVYHTVGPDGVLEKICETTLF